MVFKIGERVYYGKSGYLAVVVDVTPSGNRIKVRLDNAERDIIVLPAQITVQAPVRAEIKFEDDPFGYMSELRPPQIESVPKFEYTPELVFDNRWSDNKGDGLATFAVPVHQCVACGKLMVNGRDLAYNVNDQVERAGFVYCSDKYSDEHQGVICKTCFSSGVGHFTCELCHQTRALFEIAFQYKDAEALCKTCKTTVNADTWERAKDKIEDKHTYDEW